jgi:hypothetical protein
MQTTELRKYHEDELRRHGITFSTQPPIVAGSRVLRWPEMPNDGSENGINNQTSNINAPNCRASLCYAFLNTVLMDGSSPRSFPASSVGVFSLLSSFDMIEKKVIFALGRAPY